MNDGDSVFWGGARDMGLVAVGILSFAGAVYEYAYVHILGIDFSMANTSPVALLIAASRVFVSNARLVTSIAIVAIALAVVLATLPKHDKNAERVRALTRSRVFQAGAVVAVAFASCVLAYETADGEIRVLRSPNTNPAVITFAAGADAQYPQTLVDASKVTGAGVVVVLDTSENLYVLVQPSPGAPVSTKPSAQVFSIRKSDIASVGTFVP